MTDTNTRAELASENPYRLTGPALISFSGGRTSAYMLRQIIDAHGGQLPPDVHVCFANTGKEREETLRFVHECATRWNVRVRWLEWVKRKERGSKDWTEGFDEVGYNSASRQGEPFARLITDRGFLPNAVTRYCTAQLKVRVQEWFMRSQGYERWNNAVGLRADEQHRVKKQRARNASGHERYTALMPMHEAGVTVRHIHAFWSEQPFDLALQPWEGNCDLCFLKHPAKRMAIIRDRPDLADWWIKQEEDEAALRDHGDWGARFDRNHTYAELSHAVAASPLLPLIGDEHDAECGLWCAGEAA